MSAANICGCVGPQGGEPYCPCVMRRQRAAPSYTPYHIGDPMPGREYDNWPGLAHRAPYYQPPSLSEADIRRIIREELARKPGEDAA